TFDRLDDDMLVFVPSGTCFLPATATRFAGFLKSQTPGVAPLGGWCFFFLARGTAVGVVAVLLEDIGQLVLLENIPGECEIRFLDGAFVGLFCRGGFEGGGRQRGEDRRPFLITACRGRPL